MAISAPGREGAISRKGTWIRERWCDDTAEGAEKQKLTSLQDPQTAIKAAGPCRLLFRTTASIQPAIYAQ